MMAAKLGPKAPSKPVRAGESCNGSLPQEAAAAGTQTIHDIPKANTKKAKSE
jgi:hypothetical protein